jgi:hypothetical protein
METIALTSLIRSLNPLAKIEDYFCSLRAIDWWNEAKLVGTALLLAGIMYVMLCYQVLPPTMIPNL